MNSLRYLWGISSTGKILFESLKIPHDISEEVSLLDTGKCFWKSNAFWKSTSFMEIFPRVDVSKLKLHSLRIPC